MKGWFWILPVVVTMVLAGGFMYSRGQQELPAPDPDYRLSRVLPIPVPMEVNGLSDHHGRPFGMDALYRHWSFVYQLQRECNDHCRSELKVLSARLDHWVENEGFANTQFVLLPVEAGESSSLRERVQEIDRRFLAVSGAEEPLSGWRTGLFGGEGAGNTLAVIDPLGRLLAYVQPPFEAGALDHDYRKIRERYGAECCISDARPLEIVRIRGQEAGPDQPPELVRVK